ncbi:hypothetical protein NA2_15227 [Nitratireductor pacificus pht-3B]|uniref:Uncharacterized protein n=1 Tax=Nitratireductor pacificus pht-3B TaxID=391937 RepID=K2MAS6_9HYPH|nr:hypothetical protein NA2_15227 [Nitratireductor pacificus pht-3B]
MACILNLILITAFCFMLLSGSALAREGYPSKPGCDPECAAPAYPPAGEPPRAPRMNLLHAGPRDRWPRQPGKRCCIFTCICVNPWLVQFG